MTKNKINKKDKIKINGECIFCFLTSIKQKRIKKLAQVQEEKFEDILEKYKEIFVKEFSILKYKSLCENHKKIFKSYDIFNTLKTITDQEIEDFFENIIEVYKDWISGEAFTSIKKLDELLTKEKLIFNPKENVQEKLFNINDKVFFRGRKAEKNIFNSYDMFHIPYDKRYLVGNQRFSLSGYPLLYLNASIKGVVAELDIEEDSFNDYVFSAFHFNNPARVYTLENPFKVYLLKEYNKSNDLILEEDITKEVLKNKIFKFILSSICCFEKRIQHKKQEQLGKNVFYEEYVIPQALTQVLKLHKYDGIYYPSTRVNNLEKGLFKSDIFNLAYFPKYQKRHYDYELYESLDITTPISYESIKDITQEEIKFNDLFVNIYSNNKLSPKDEEKIFQLMEIYVCKDEEEGKKNIEKINKMSYHMNEVLFNNFLIKNLLKLPSEKGENNGK